MSGGNLEKDRRPVPPMPPVARDILEAVARANGLTAADLVGRSTRRAVAAPRAEVILRMRNEVTVLGRPPSLPQIGRWMNRDHTTVLYAIAKLESAMADAPRVKVQPGLRPQFAADLAERSGL